MRAGTSTSLRLMNYPGSSLYESLSSSGGFPHNVSVCVCGDGHTDWHQYCRTVVGILKLMIFTATRYMNEA